MEQKVKKLYSIWQILVATFLGGPIPIIIMMHHNYKIFNETSKAQSLLFWGTILTATLILSLPFIPDYVPSTVFTAGYTAAAYSLAQEYPLKKQEIQESSMYDFKSNWQVFLIAIVSFISFIALGLCAMMGFEQMGYISLDE